ncbi:MAG TPA: choice-of-anchor tandem repeat GloVer-containing protein [Terriglobales bacterium]|nr:choice-of-anchor tandem repeat GloVer-containing protein [Terriglobales bacterium]
MNGFTMQWQRATGRVLLAVLVTLMLAITTSASSTEQAIYTFTGGSSDGSNPLSALIADKEGNLYGTTLTGGGNPHCSPFGQSCGVVFQLAPSSGGGWTEKVLYTFTGGADGGYSYNSLVMDANGNLYGTTDLGGTPTGGCPGGTCGTVFELSPPKQKGGSWKEKVLYSFCSQSGCTDGAYPQDRLILDKQGNIYGTTNVGGLSGGCNTSGFGGYGCGVVFKLTHGKKGWKESVLYAFNGASDGGFPYAGVIFDKVGNLYGTTNGEGGSGAGTVYQLKKGAHGWTENTLYSFTGAADGGYSVAPLTMDTRGNLYGTAQSGGANFYGTVFELKHANGGWTQSTLYTFTGGQDGGYPSASLVMKGKSLYGTSWGGGNKSGCFYGCGAVFSLSRSSNGWNETTLYSFQGGADGGEPDNAVLFDSKGNLYGTTTIGGDHGAYGVVYEITH